VDPKNPGAVDEIIHLGDYWNEALLRQSKEGILSDNRRVGRLFGTAYFGLQEAMVAVNEWESYVSEAQNWARVNQIFSSTWTEIMGGAQPQWNIEADSRHLFAWAISPKGKTQFIDSIIQGVRIKSQIPPGREVSGFMVGTKRVVFRPL